MNDLGGESMKQKILALILAVCTVFTMMSVPASALDEGSGVVQTVRAMGILVGDTNGNLNLGRNVTRAEFAKMIVAASSYKDSIGDGTGSSLFKDVKSSHWASAYIKIAVEQGWMVGYTDGTFRPTRTISVEEACTTVLRVLGYEASDLAGSYPTAQLTKASALGLRDDISLSQGGIMTRGNCAQLFYNMMTAQTKAGQVYAATMGYSLNASGEVDYAAVVNATMSGPYVAGEGGTAALPFTASAVYRNGAASALSAITQYDVYYYNQNLRTVWVYTDRAAGTITAITPSGASPTTVTVAGTTYTIGASTAAYKLSSMGSFKVGDTATLLLGMDGTVVDVLDIALSNQIYYGMVLASSRTTTVSGSAAVEKAVEVVCTDGSVRTFTVEKDKTYSKGNLVSVTVTENGTVISNLAARSATGAVNSDGTKIGSLKVAGDVQILDTTSDGAYAVISAARLAGTTLQSGAVRYYALNENGEISHMLLNNATGDVWNYCFLVELTKQDGSSASPLTGYYACMEDGKSTTLTTTGKVYGMEDETAIAYRYDADGAIADMKKLTSFPITELTTLYAVSDGTRRQLSDDVQVYLKSGSSYYAATLSSVDGASYKLTGWYDSFGAAAGGRVRVIIAEAR